MRAHRIFFLLWITAGVLMMALSTLEFYAGTLFSAAVHAACVRLSDHFGLDAATLHDLTMTALPGMNIFFAATGFTLSAMAFTCAWYCRRLVVRSRYIIRLERAAVAEFTEKAREEEKQPAPVSMVGHEL